MEAAHIPWRPLGELFVARGLISEEELEHALAEQAATKQRLGEILVSRHLISSPELTQALMEQLGREVAKEEGFGSGLWAEIQRRQARPEDRPGLSLVVEDHDPFSPEPGDAVEEPVSHDGGGDELERDIEELKSELGVVPPESSPVHEELSDPTNIELERVRHELRERSATIDTLTSELEATRRSLEAREQTFAEEIDSWQNARREADALREDLSRRDSRLVELEAEVASLTLSREQETAGKTARAEQAEHDLTDARQQLQAHAARVTGLESTLDERDQRIQELQSILAEIRAERDASNESRVQAESRAADAERELLDAQAPPAVELEQRLLVAQSRVAELETTLRAEQEAHASARQHSEQVVAEAAGIREALREAERELEAARSERDTGRAELEPMQATATALEGQASTLGEQLVALEATLAAERNALQEAEGRCEDACRERDRARAELAEVAGVREALREAERELELARGERDAGRAELEQARADLDRARATALDSEQRLAVAGGRAVELDGQVSAFGERLVAIETALAAERNALQEAEGQREHACRERDTARAELEQTREGQIKFESVLLDERDAHASARQRSEEAVAKLESAEAKLQVAEDREAELVSQIERLAKETAELSAAASRERESADLHRADIASRLAEEAASHTETRHVLAQALDELMNIRAETGSGDEEAPPHGLEGYLCFAPGTEGYRLLAFTGLPPGMGDSYELEGVEHIVTRVGRSPLPFDRRRCVYLQAVS